MSEKASARVMHGTDQRDSKGIYAWADERYPSVTTIIKVLDKPALPRWAAKSVAEHVASVMAKLKSKEMSGADVARDLSDSERLKQVPWIFAEKKRDIGTSFHRVAERYAEGKSVALDKIAEDVRPLVAALVTWLGEVKPEFEYIEVPIYYRGNGPAKMEGDRFPGTSFAGTADFIATIGGKRYLGDYKTGKGVYPESALQLCALAGGEFIGDVETGKEVPLGDFDGIFVLHVQDGGCVAYEWPLDAVTFEAFLGLRAAYRWQRTNPKKTEVKL